MQPSSVWRNHSQKIWSADFQSKRGTIKISFPGFLIMYSVIKHITKKSVPTSLSILPQGGSGSPQRSAGGTKGVPATPESEFPSTGGGDRIAVGRVHPPPRLRRYSPTGGSPQLLSAISPPPEGGDRIAVGRVTPLPDFVGTPPQGENISPRRVQILPHRGRINCGASAPAGGGFPGGHPRTPAHSVHRFPSQAGASSP